MKRVLILTIAMLLFSMTVFAANGDLIINGSLQFADGSRQSSAASTFPAGSIVMYGGASAPAGWLLANGSAVSRTGTYAALFAAIGTTYGSGDGSTTFNLPDFRGVFPKGAGTTARTDPNTAKDASGNLYSAVLGSYRGDQMQGHVHQAVGVGSYSFYASFGSAANNLTSTGIPIADGTNGTPRTGHTTEPQSLGINFIIKY
jgi:microcystin-dependent protein